MRIFGLVCALLFAINSLANSATGNQPQFIANTVIIKIKPEFSSRCFKDTILIPELSVKLKKYGQVSQQQLFPNSKNKAVDLSLIYEITFTTGNASTLLQTLNSLSFIAYAEPKAIHYLDYLPNDVLIGEQWYLDTIEAYQAWDIQKGDTNVVIGIIDTGIDIDHEDLVNGIKYNYADPIDGNDNDGDGYTDNFRGWDMSDNDNNPQDPSTQGHGTQVAGCVGAEVDNSLGISGVSFKCKILPVKVVKDGTSPLNGIDKGYEGIVYAADHGAKVINCSWGSAYASQYGKDIIDYAIAQGCMVVAAAGNTSSDSPHYPAAFDEVLAVVNTLKTDILAPTSGHGHWVDLCSPGSSIKTTMNGNEYTINSGTSFAAPVASGVAALVWSQYPDYTYQEIIERLKVTTDSIEHIAENNGYINQLGDGRLNLYQALIQTNIPAIVATDFVFADNNDQQWLSNDTISLQLTFKNILDSTGGLVAELNTTSPYVSIINSIFNIGSLAKGQSINNGSDLFEFAILPSALYNQNIEFTIDITGSNNYKRTIPFSIDVNNYFVDIKVNDLWLTVSSDGQIGYYEENQAAGIGVQYNGSSSLLFDGSFMIGVPGKVADMARGIGSSNDKDFIATSPVTVVEIPLSADIEAKGSFSDSIPFNYDEIGVKVNHKAYAWDKSGHRDYVIHEYTIVNRINETIDSLYAGIFADWDLGDANNMIASDMQKGFGYCYDPGGIYYTGIKELTHWKFIHQAMYNDSGGEINPNGTFSSNIKYRALNEFYGWAGWDSGQDVSHIVSTGPYNIPSGDSITVAFALMASESLTDMQKTADSAYMQYNGKLISGLEEQTININIYPNPAIEYLHISVTNKAQYTFQLIDITGKVVTHDSFIGNFSLQRNNLSDGVYLLNISNATGVVLTTKVEWLSVGE